MAKSNFNNRYVIVTVFLFIFEADLSTDLLNRKAKFKPLFKGGFFNMLKFVNYYFGICICIIFVLR